MERFVRFMGSIPVNIIVFILLNSILAFFDLNSFIFFTILIFFLSIGIRVLVFISLKQKVSKEKRIYVKSALTLGIALFIHLFTFLFVPSNKELAVNLIENEVVEVLDVKRARDTYPFFEREAFFKFTKTNGSLKKVLLKNGYKLLKTEEHNDYESPFWFPSLTSRKTYYKYSKMILENEKVTSIYVSKDSDKVYAFVLYW